MSMWIPRNIMSTYVYPVCIYLNGVRTQNHWQMPEVSNTYQRDAMYIPKNMMSMEKSQNKFAMHVARICPRYHTRYLYTQNKYDIPQDDNK